jgi:hypothetical protein
MFNKWYNSCQEGLLIQVGYNEEDITTRPDMHGKAVLMNYLARRGAQ